MNTTSCADSTGALAYIEVVLILLLSTERIIARLAKLFRKPMPTTKIHVESSSSPEHYEEDRVTTIDIEETK